MCRALRKGITKEKMQRGMGLSAVLSVKARIHINRLDMEENHESEEVDIEAPQD